MRAEERFLKTYDEISEKLLRHIILKVGNRELAEDLLQETFMKAWRTLAEDKQEIDNLRAFVYRIANNLIIDHYRSKYKQTLELNENLELPDAHNIEAEIDTGIAKQKLDSILQDLPDETREIIIYKYIDDLKVRDISQLTGKSIMNINVIAHRAMKQLKKKFNETSKS